MFRSQADIRFTMPSSGELNLGKHIAFKFEVRGDWENRRATSYHSEKHRTRPCHPPTRLTYHSLDRYLLSDVLQTSRS